MQSEFHEILKNKRQLIINSFSDIEKAYKIGDRDATQQFIKIADKPGGSWTENWRKLTPEEAAASPSSTPTPKNEEKTPSPQSAPKIKLEALIEKGVNPDDMIKLSGKPASEVFKAIMSSGKDISSFTNSYEESEADISAMPKPSVKARWQTYDIYTDMVTSGIRKSMVAYGKGGVGKTFTVLKNFKAKGLKNYHQLIKDQEEAGNKVPEDFEGGGEAEQEGQVDPLYTTPYYAKYTGTMSGPNLFKTLFEHRHENATILFDDIDAVLKNSEMVNMLKGVLDTTGDGMVNYAKDVEMVTDQGEAVPKSFEFKGKAIFISNLSKDEMPQPIKSRALTIDLTMNKQETMEKFAMIKDKMEFQDAAGRPLKLDETAVNDAFNFIKEHLDQIQIDDLNGRTFGSVALIRNQIKSEQDKGNPVYDGIDWKESAALMFQK